MGVFPNRYPCHYLDLSLPHARGGVSVEDLQNKGYVESSPRPWGCFHAAQRLRERGVVFPTPVGVFLWSIQAQGADKGLPHARGGVSA